MNSPAAISFRARMQSSVSSQLHGSEIGASDICIKNTNSVEDLTSEHHAAVQVADRADHFWQTTIRASQDSRTHSETNGAVAGPERFDPPHCAEDAGSLGSRSQRPKPTRVRNGVIVEEGDQFCACSRDA
jgi:hypothetical protein